MNRHVVIAAAVGFALLMLDVSASAAEIKVMASNALKTTLEELVPAFEKAGEHKIAVQWGAAAPLKTEIEKGARFDVAILTRVYKAKGLDPAG
jgi:molybdate transport system substrate-binding protein